MAQAGHNAIIARAAKQELGPIGFHQKGRSRTWIRDHGYWLTIVEFQPSGFSRGSSLNVSAHWLWNPPPYFISFDYRLTNQSGQFIQYENETQFEPFAIELAKRAGYEDSQLVARLRSIDVIAKLLLEKQNQLSQSLGRAVGDWDAFHAAVASGLVGDTETSLELFSLFAKERGLPFAEWIGDGQDSMRRGIFEDYVRGEIGAYRKSLKLPEWAGSF